MEYDFPMKWHKFLIYFSLWAGAVINLFGGVATMTGLILGKNAQAVYAAAPAYQTLNIVYGGIMLLDAAACLIIRNGLARYRRFGPKWLIVLFVFNMILTPLYAVLSAAVTKVPLGMLMDGSDAVQFLVQLALIIATHVYYQKREALFTE